MFYDDPKIVYENPPPPSDDFEYDHGPFFFTFPRPQYIQGPCFIKIDYSLIHKSLLGYEEEQTTSETLREDPNTEAIETGKLNAEVLVNTNVEDGIDKIIDKPSKENLEKNGIMDKTKSRSTILLEDESAVCSEKKTKEKRNKSMEKKKTDSDDPKKQKTLVTKTSALQSISKTYSMSESDSDNSEKRKTKSPPHSSRRHSKKSSRHRRKDKDSRSDKIAYDKASVRSAEFSVKKEVFSDEESVRSSFSIKAEIPMKEEVLSDKDDYEKELESYKKISDISRSRDDSRSRESFDARRNRDDSRSRESFDARRSRDDSRNRAECRSRDDSRGRQDRGSRYGGFQKNYSDNSSDDDSRNRHYDDSYDYKIKQEMKQEPGTSGPPDYHCKVCKLVLNSETTFNSHIAGKKHKKALRQLSEQEVAKSSVLEITESQNFPRPTGIERIELYDEVSRVQLPCEEPSLLIVGLDYVQEIRGYDETKYFCDMCSAQCVANSIVKHLIGYKHKLNCLKTYYPKSYAWVNGLERHDKRVQRELKYKLEEEKRRHGRGRIRVFKDIKRGNQRSPEPYDPYQPSTSRQSQNIQPPSIKTKEVKGSESKTVTDEDCLSRNFSDFYCIVCDSHMNNQNMWETHVVGKRHLKNKKKAPEGSATNSNFIEAPYGTKSHLEQMIEEECDPRDTIVGLGFIRESQGENGNLYNCYLCGSVCPSIDIIDHIFLKKHKAKYLEKMDADGHRNSIGQINSLAISESARESLIDDECDEMMKQYGRGKPVIGITK